MSTLDLAPDAILRVDARRVIVAANVAACDLTGYTVEELVGQDCGDLLVPRGRDGRRLWANGWHPSASLRSVRMIPEQHVTIRRADGSDVQTHLTGRYDRGPDGVPAGAVLVVRERVGRLLEVATGIELVSIVSHELRSPLTAVKGYTGMLLNRWGRLSDEQKRMFLEQVQHEADRVTRLITELLDISRLEIGRLQLRRQLVDLRQVTERVVDKVRLTETELSATVGFADDLPRVMADPDKVEQVLTNLVENACKYASPQGICVRGEVRGNDIAVSVTDVGEGIPHAELPKIFQKFHRRAEGKPTGSGLGLWISRGLVEAHGGRLSATSELGVGSTFCFTLPLVDPEEVPDT